MRASAGCSERVLCRFFIHVTTPYGPEPVGVRCFACRSACDRTARCRIVEHRGEMCLDFRPVCRERGFERLHIGEAHGLRKRREAVLSWLDKNRFDG